MGDADIRRDLGGAKPDGMDGYADFCGIASGITALGIVAIAEQEDPGEILFEQAAFNLLQGSGDIGRVAAVSERIKRGRGQLVRMGGEPEIADGHLAVEPRREFFTQEMVCPLAAADPALFLLHARRLVDSDREQGRRGLYLP